MDASHERLQWARQNAGYATAKDAIEAFGWKGSTYYGHENGDRGMSRETIMRYAQAYNVPAAWLEDGEPASNPAQVIPFSGQGARKPPPPEPNLGQTQVIAPLSHKLLPVYGYAQGGAEGQFLMNGQVQDRVPCPALLENAIDPYAVIIRGDSMEPRHTQDQVAYVHPAREPSRGCSVVVQVRDPDGGSAPLGYVKEYITRTPTRLILRQYNPEREIEFEMKDVVSIHRVVLWGDRG